MVKFGLGADAAGPPGAGGAAPPGGADPTPTQLAHYQNRIVAKLVSVLTDLRDSKGRGVEPKAVAGAFEEAIRSTNELLTPSQSGFTRPLLSPLLMNPIELSWAGVLNDLGGTAGGNWEADVWRNWHSQLEDGYPFSDTWRDVKLTDYTEFFKPGGTLFGFYDAHLSASLEKNGKHFVPATRFKHSLNYSGTFIRCYERGLEISNNTFPAKSDAPRVEFETNLHSVSPDISEVTFDLDGAKRSYSNAPEEWIHAQWPAKDPRVTSSRVRIRGYSGLEEEIVRPGEWGFFRLLDAASSIAPGTEGGRPGGRPTIVVTWQMRTQPGSFVKMDIRPLREENPFTAYITKKERLFRGYNCPRITFHGVR
jgi:type VI protein secretion system component VasK